MKGKLIKTLSLFAIGGLTYITIEAMWRYIMGSHPTHWTMFLLGGLVFVLIGGINEYFPWTMPFWLQDIIGTGIVLLAEFIFGCVLNLWLGLGVWDYSDVPFNLFGQICLPFAVAWLFLVGIAIILDDYLRYWLFKEDKPHYKWSLN